MTKSKKLIRAMLCVIDSEKYSAADRLDILEVLLAEKKIAEWAEKAKEEGGEK